MLKLVTSLQERQVEFLPFIVEDSKIGYIHPRYVRGISSLCLVTKSLKFFVIAVRHFHWCLILRLHAQ